MTEPFRSNAEWCNECGCMVGDWSAHGRWHRTSAVSASEPPQGQRSQTDDVPGLQPEVGKTALCAYIDNVSCQVCGQRIKPGQRMVCNGVARWEHVNAEDCAPSADDASEPPQGQRCPTCRSEVEVVVSGTTHYYRPASDVDVQSLKAERDFLAVLCADADNLLHLASITRPSPFTRLEMERIVAWQERHHAGVPAKEADA